MGVTAGSTSSASVPSSPAWYCPSCRSPASSKYQSAAAAAHSVVAKKPKQFPLVQTKIVDFFKIQRNPTTSADVSAEVEKRKRKSGGTVVASKKKSRRILSFIPSSDAPQRLRQMASLATALTVTGAAFSNTSATLEAGEMQVMNREDAETVARCQRMMARGEWPPLVVAYDPVEGFTVEGDRCIRDLTIITEYVGDVDFLHNREHDDGDSIVTLLSAASPTRSLVICPDRRSNIARFINGINNHTPEGRKKQNLKCVRFDVGGECRVLLVANRDISKGERLYYDYNGSEHEYPTHHFV